MKNKIGISCMVLGIAFIAGALSLFLWNQYRENKAAEASAEILSKIEDNMNDNSFVDPYDTDMTVKMIDGYGYVGYLMIPALDISLPVMSEFDYKRMEIAPCRYYGSTKTNDFVISAHNYLCHFGRISKLKNGDQVIFKDMDKITTQYKVAAVDILSDTAVEEMTSGDYDLTLFTCTYGGKSRVAVRCIKA